MPNMPRRTHAKTVEIDADRVAKLLRLLGSDKPGEVVAAAAALKRTLEAAGQDLHDLADIVEAGLRPMQQRTSGPPQPDPGNWESLAWFCHHHRHRLPTHQRELVEDLLLGRAQHQGRVMQWHLQELRRIAASLREVV
jgi:hypothetical protein